MDRVGELVCLHAAEEYAIMWHMSEEVDVLMYAYLCHFGLLKEQVFNLHQNSGYITVIGTELCHNPRTVSVCISVYI